MKIFKFYGSFFFFMSFLFCSNSIFPMPGQGPGMEDPMGDFPESVDPEMPQDDQLLDVPAVQEPLSPGASSVAQPDQSQLNISPESVQQPNEPFASSPEPMPEEAVSTPVPIPGDTGPGQALPGEEPVPIAPEPPSGGPSPVAGVPGPGPNMTVPTPVVSGPDVSGMQPAAPATTPIEETQFPLIEPEQGKLIDVTEKSGPLVKSQDVNGLQKILSEAEFVEKKINDSFVAIKNVAIEIESKFKNMDKQLDLVYQTVGFNRGVAAQALSK